MSAGVEPRPRAHFHCRGCGNRFEAEPGRVEAAAELEHHPWRYFARCPACESEAPQAAWEQALFKAWVNATGPKTAEGIARTAANLEGHPTPDEAKRTRFNAMRHGLCARTATYFPAKPGHYPHCEGCEYLAARDCVPAGACLKRTELFLRHQVAFETGDPRQLTQLAADRQAALAGLIDDMILAIAQDGGPRIKDVVWYHDKEGGFHLAEFIDEDGEKRRIHELKEHPLLRTLILYIEKNRMTLADLNMTPRLQDDDDVLQGFLDAKKETSGELLEYEKRQAAALEGLVGMIQRSQTLTRRDPVLIEHQGATDD